MSLLVTGSIGIDDVKTPYGEVTGVYGGSAVYFSFAALLFSPVRKRCIRRLGPLTGGEPTRLWMA